MPKDPIVLMVPGLWNSEPEHWQSLWEAEEPTWRRVQQGDWDRPRSEVGPLGHINAASGIGRWPEGHALLTTLLK